MSFKGDLSTIGLAEVFQMISMSQKEGTLIVQDVDSRKSIYFGATGVRLVSTGKRKGLRLGDMLLRSGKIGESDLQDALENAKIQKRMLGEILVENGYLAEGEIEDVVRAQIEEEIYDLFTWQRANYEFIEGPPPDNLVDPDARVTQLSFDVNGLLLEAVRRADEWGVINQKIPSMDTVFMFNSEADRNEEDQASSDGDRRVYRLIDGQTTCSEIVENTGVGEFDVAKVLTDLVDRNRIRLLNPQELMDVAASRLVEGRRDIALRMYHAAAAQSPGDPKIMAGIARILENEGEPRQAAANHLKAGRVYLESGDLDRALDHLQRAGSLDPDDPEIKFGVFEAHAADGNLGEGKKIARDLISQCWTNQNYERGRDLCDRILYADTEDIDFRVWRARILNQLREKDALGEDLEYIKKHLPADPGERERVEVLLRDLEGRKSTVVPPSRPKSGPASRIVRPRPRRTGRIVAGVVFVVLLALGGFVGLKYFESGVALDDAVLESRSFADHQEFVEARRRIESFEKASFLNGLFQSGRLREYFLELEDRQRNAEAGRKERLAKERGDMINRIGELENAIRLDRQRNPNLALSHARQMRDLALEAEESASVARAEELARDIEKYIFDALQLKRQAEQMEEEGKIRDSALLLDRLLVDFPNTNAARGALYPMEIVSTPPGVKVYNDRSSLLMGQTTDEPLLIRMKPAASIRLRFEKPGYAPVRRDVQDKTLGRMVVALTEKHAQWRMPLGFGVSGEAALIGDTLFVAGESRLYALKALATAGTLLWFESLEGNVVGAPTVAGGRVYVGTDKGWVYAVDPAKAEEVRIVWSRELGGRILSTPGISAKADRVYVGTDDRTLHVLDGGGGDVLWTRGLPGGAEVSPVAGEGAVYVGCSDGTILALKGPGPEGELWRFRAEAGLGPMAVSGRSLYVSAGAYLYAVDVNRGSRIWKRLLAPGVTGRVAHWEDRVFAAGRQGRVHFLSAATGDSKDEFEAGAAVKGGVVLAGDLLLFGSEGGKFYAYDVRRNTLRWRFAAEGQAQAGCTLDGDRVFVCSGGSLYALSLE